MEYGNNYAGLKVFLNTMIALVISLLLFAIFILAVGANPVEVFAYMIEGSFGSSFSVQTTILMAAPLLFVAFATALPAKLGMVVIGGEGTLVIGGLFAAITGVAMRDFPYFITMAGMFLSAFVAGGLWLGMVGLLRYYKGANETIVSLLLNYIAIAVLNQLVEGVLQDPASLNKPSTYPIGTDKMMGVIPGTDIHYGVIFGAVMAILMYFLFHRSSFGFSVNVVGGNRKAAQLAGLPIARVIILTFFLAGGIAGLAGMVEVTAVHGKANASLVAGYGYTGILVSFLARHNSLAIIPVTVLFGALTASNGLIQRRCELPDATMFVLQGIIFVTIIGFEGFQSKNFREWFTNLKASLLPGLKKQETGKSNA